MSRKDNFLTSLRKSRCTSVMQEEVKWMRDEMNTRSDLVWRGAFSCMSINVFLILCMYVYLYVYLCNKTSNANLMWMLQATSFISCEPSHTCTCVHAMKMIYQWDGQLDSWMGWANVACMIRPSSLILQQKIACISWGIVDCTYEPHIVMFKDTVHVCKVICAFERCYYTS